MTPQRLVADSALFIFIRTICYKLNQVNIVKVSFLIYRIFSLFMTIHIYYLLSTEVSDIIKELNHTFQIEVHKQVYFFKNACYSVTKYYLCRQNNKRSLLGRIQRLEVARSFPNRYLFSSFGEVTYLFSNRYILTIILQSKRCPFGCY